MSLNAKSLKKKKKKKKKQQKTTTTKQTKQQQQVARSSLQKVKICLKYGNQSRKDSCRLGKSVLVFDTFCLNSNAEMVYVLNLNQHFISDFNAQVSASAMEH